VTVDTALDPLGLVDRAHKDADQERGARPLNDPQFPGGGRIGAPALGRLLGSKPRAS